ncbi:hypothetical protein [Bifidobacterium biavatii]|uniref:Uncharacterized protein n=1 Tax=Bifidobacterium biavatii DSM 23969 TaxID=1437608 RepID=A0A086ZHW9_9BIFI|nr:hypothetical protein [Bifidobacterium biavatii]KFI46119.1 hypothetical protein BBIA_2084 [Bifidobacterium biavatii DSM 23969]
MKDNIITMLFTVMLVLGAINMHTADTMPAVAFWSIAFALSATVLVMHAVTHLDNHQPEQ